MDCSPPGSSVHGILWARICERVHSLFQGIFPIQGLNLGLLHGKQILYHLSHQGNPLHICPWLYKCLDDTVLSWGHQKMGHFWKQVTFNGSLWRWEGTERKVGVTGVAPGRWYVWRSVCLYFFL